MIVISMSFYGCNPASNPVRPSSVSGAESPTPNVRQKYATPSEIEGKNIWTGNSGGTNIWWTTVDLYHGSTSEIQSVWKPLAQQGFEDFLAINSDSEPSESPTMLDCEYARTFTVMSVVGTLVSFEDSYDVYCGGAHPEINTRFTTIDLTKSGNLSYAKGQTLLDVDPHNPGKVVLLTDYFTQEDILRALLADRVVQKALKTVNATTPQTLAELVALFEKNDYELVDSGYELRPDFLTRFAFHHVEGNRVAVRVGLPPHYGANRAMHLQLGLLLPIPQRLKMELAVASSLDHGFLMKDSKRISNGQITTIKLNTDGQNVK